MNFWKTFVKSLLDGSGSRMRKSPAQVDKNIFPQEDPHQHNFALIFRGKRAQLKFFFGKPIGRETQAGLGFPDLDLGLIRLLHGPGKIGFKAQKSGGAPDGGLFGFPNLVFVFGKSG